MTKINPMKNEAESWVDASGIYNLVKMICKFLPLHSRRSHRVNEASIVKFGYNKNVYYYPSNTAA